MYLVVKRMIDFILSLIALIGLSPLFLLLALWIKIDSTGLVFLNKNVWVKTKRFSNFISLES